MAAVGSGAVGRTIKLCGIRFERISKGAGQRRYLLIHGDESTARQVLKDHLSSGSGKGSALLVENVTRYVTMFGGRLDPNRIFSNEGAEWNLRTLNPQWSETQVLSAVTYLGEHRHQVVNKLLPPQGGVLIALHNNQRGYTMKSEMDISDDVALNEPDHPEDFGLCVNPGDFERVRRGPYNFVLQARGRGREDGSLSRLAGRMGIRYLNLEAGLGNLEKQRLMLQWVEQALS